MSPAIQALIDKGLFDRLPATFSTFFYQQIQEWELLFPAEQSYHERLFGLLDRSDPQAVEELFAPLRVVEQKMGVNAKNWPRRQFTLDQVDFLNRSAHYPEWRAEIARIFGRLDPVLEQDVSRKGRPRLVVVTSPSDLPVGPDRMWLRLRKHGRAVAIEWPDSASLPDLLASLTHARQASAYEQWLIEANSGLPEQPESVLLSYAALADYRTRLMSDVQKIVETEQIRGPRQLGERLKTLRILKTEGTIGRDPRLAEFARAILLSGNGTLLINNTFAEWATIQAARRARPVVSITSFGIRNKLKPFSSLLIYTDQDKATPVPTQMDTLGTYVDLEIFYQYIWQEFEKYPEYRQNTVYLFIGELMDGMFVIAPPDFQIAAKEGQRLSITDVFRKARQWVG